METSGARLEWTDLVLGPDGMGQPWTPERNCRWLCREALERLGLAVPPHALWSEGWTEEDARRYLEEAADLWLQIPGPEDACELGDVVLSVDPSEPARAHLSTVCQASPRLVLTTTKATGVRVLPFWSTVANARGFYRFQGCSKPPSSSS